MRGRGKKTYNNILNNTAVGTNFYGIFSTRVTSGFIATFFLTQQQWKGQKKKW